MGYEYLVATSDLHAGSTVGLCPPNGIKLDDGGYYKPGKHQDWLWECWEDAWKKVDRIVDGVDWQLVLNGDMIDGFHHNTPQICSSLTGTHMGLAMDCLEQCPLKLNPKAVHVIKGTEAHVGRSGESEEGLARIIANQGFNVVRDPDTGMSSSFERRLMVGDKLVHLTHHGRQGQRSHTRDAYSRLFAHDIWEEHVRRGDRPPDLCIYGHHHRYMDSGFIHDLPTRAVTLPAWQLRTAFSHRCAFTSMPDVGLTIFRFDGFGVDVIPILYKPERATVIA